MATIELTDDEVSWLFRTIVLLLYMVPEKDKELGKGLLYKLARVS